MPLRTNKICITNLPASTLYQEIQQIFKKFGTIVRVYIVCEDGTKTCSGRAYIAYKTNEEATMAKDAMNNKEFNGSTISVTIASEEEYSLEVRHVQAPSVGRNTQESTSVTVTYEGKERETLHPFADKPRSSSKKARFSKSWKPRGPQGFPGMRPPCFSNTPHYTSPHRMDQSVCQQQWQQHHGILGPPHDPSQSHSYPPGRQPCGPIQHQPHLARFPSHQSPLPPSDIFYPRKHHTGHRPRESNLQPPGSWPGPPAGPPAGPPVGPPYQTANLNLLHSNKSYPNPTQISPGDRPPSYLPGQSGLPSFLHHQIPSSDLSPNRHSAPAAPQKPSISNVIADLLKQITPNRVPSTLGAHQQPPCHGPAQTVHPPFGVLTRPPDRPPQTLGTRQQPPTFHSPAQAVQPPACVQTKLPATDLVSLLASGGLFLRSSSDVINSPDTDPSQPQLQNLSSTTRPTYTQAPVPQHQAWHDDSRQVPDADALYTETTTAGASRDISSTSQQASTYLRNKRDAPIPHSRPNVETNDSEQEHASPAGPLQSPQASTATPSKIAGYEVIKQIVCEYIIDDKGNKIVREYERPLGQPPLGVPPGADWSGHAVKETDDWGSVLENVTTDCRIPAKPDYQVADSTTELKHSEGSQPSWVHKAKNKEEDGTRGRSRNTSRTSSQSRSSSRSRSRSRSRARSGSTSRSRKRKRHCSTRSSSSDSSREGSRHKHASKKKLPVVWVVGDSYVLRAVERAQGSTLGLDDIVDLHWKVLSENQMLKDFKSMMDTLLDVSSEPPSMVVVHLGAYDFAEDPKDNFVGILKYMAFLVDKMKCRLVWSEMFPQLDRAGQQVYPQKHHFINAKAGDIIRELGEGNHFISYPRIHPSPELIERDCLELTQRGTDYFIRTFKRAIRVFIKKPKVSLYPRAKCPPPYPQRRNQRGKRREAPCLKPLPPTTRENVL